MSSKIRVLLGKNFFQKDLEYITSRLAENVEIVTPPDFSSETLAEVVKNEIDVFLGEPSSKNILDNAASLKLIQIPWTGVDRLNFDLLRQYPFPVCNSHSNARAVAEYAVSLMFAVTKAIPIHDRYLRQGKWCRPKQNSESFFSPPELIRNKTVGIIGYGAIGKLIAEMLNGFSVTLQAVEAKQYDTPPTPLVKIMPPVQMLDIVEESDFLFVAIPFTACTEGMINKNVFNKMKPTAYLINTSRGQVLAEEDLYNALKTKQIAGAAIDTWYNYPKPDSPDVLPSKDFPFHKLDNIVLSPHRAGFARGLLPHLDDAVENLNRLATGKPLINILDLEVGY